MGWFDEFKESCNFSQLAKIRAGLDALMHSSNIDYEKEFVNTRVYRIAYDAVDEYSYRCHGNKSFTSSYLILDGIFDERFVQIYTKTYRISRIASYARLVAADLSLQNMNVFAHKEYDISVEMFSGDKYVRVYRPLYEVVYNIASDMELAAKSLFTALILAGTKEEKYMNVYNKYIEKVENSLAQKIKVITVLARVYLNLYRRDLIEEFRKTVGFKDQENKKWWLIRNIDSGTVELARVAAKIYKKRLGDVIKEAIETMYGHLLLDEKLFVQNGES